MSHLTSGLIGAYNSLTDKHLTAYFNNVRIRRHLQRVGLISRSGRIVSEKEFRYKIIHRDQQRHIRECLAQAIFHRVLDMERLHQTEIRRKMEEFSRREKVNKMKVERCNRYEDDPVLFLSPRPPTRLRSSQARHSGPEREPSDSTDSLGSSRPNTAPEKTQRPVRLKPLNSDNTQTSSKRNLSRYRNDLTNDREQPLSCTMDRDVMRHLTLTDFSSSVSPYRLPVINNFVTPVPPPRKKDNIQNGTLRGRRLRPTTAPSDAPDTKEGTVQQAWSRSVVWVKMVYFGKSLHLSHDPMEPKDDVKVFQQHCGGENLCVYKGRLKEGESFQFLSRRHRGFPFSLTFYLNGLQVKRLSSCCEFKHKKNSRIGGHHALFGFSGVEGATPCYRCIIAMGLDKKPAPPKGIRNDPLVSWKNQGEEEKCSQSESSQSHNNETKRNTNQEHKRKNGYEEDFEADDEDPMNDGVDEGNKTSPSLCREEEDERRKDENGNEDLNSNKVRGSSSVSSGLSCSEEDEDELEEEQENDELNPNKHTANLSSIKDAEENEILGTNSVSLLTKDESPNQEMEHIAREYGEAEQPKDDAEEAKEPRNECGEAEEPRGEPEKIEEPGEAQKAREDIREGRADANKERNQAKSVQEKFAKAFLIMTECVSEPELSDSSTEEDELVSVEIQQLSPVPGAEPESNMAQQTTDEENGAEPVQKAEREEAHAEEPKEEPEKETQETPQPETKAGEELKHTNQTEVKVFQNTTNEDEHVQDEPNNGDDMNEDQKPEIKQDRIDEEDKQEQEDNNVTNEDNKSNKEPEMMEKLEDKETKDGEKHEKETTNENSVNAAETRATQVYEELSMMEDITVLHPENPKETSGNHENMEQNTELEKGLSGNNVCAEDPVTVEVRADAVETFDEESRNLRYKETGNDITECVGEGNIENRELNLKSYSANEVKDEDIAGKGEKSEEPLEVHETEGKKEQSEDGDGDETDLRNGVDKVQDKDEITGEENNEENINTEMPEDRSGQNEASSKGQVSKDKGEVDVGEREDELAEGEQKAVSEGKDTGDNKHEEELKENTSLKETKVGGNKLEVMSEDGEERIDAVETDAEMQKIVMEQDDKEEQKDSDSTVHEALQETTDGSEVKPGWIEAENREDIITADQEELDKKEAAGAENWVEWSETNEEKINQEVTKEDVKDEQRDEDNEIADDQRETHQETKNEEEEHEVGEETFEQKQNIQQDTNNKEDIKKPLTSEYNNNAATEDEDSSEAKTPAEDPADANSEPKDTNVDLQSRGEEENRGGSSNHIQSSTETKKDKSINAAEESSSVEGSTTPYERSQPLEKDMLVKREERGAELFVAPLTDNEELVSNWVNVHQASNYFETFVEPLYEIKILDRERTVNENMETDKTEESHRNENAKGEQISEREEMEDMIVENMETEALGTEGQRNPSYRNPSEEEDNQTQIDSEQTEEAQEDVAINKVMNISATPLMKTEISQGS
ncbi:glutamate-rich protein 3 [Tachysurus vachellii]|uniref:glutamate-rich protein 3 n=1 Tax=Tachysurus vachellii TaxID=175792 RepID=UPI00296B0705|nr:glutamate-rich protein 3 [Tachysurus vachellii]